MYILRFLVLCIVLPSLFSCGSNTTPKIPENTTKVSAIPAAYAKNCSKCHGDDGKLMLAGAKDLSASKLSIDEVMAIIRAGKGAMPPYGSMLTESELQQTADFVMTLRP